jgi:hypothetical protein
VLVLVQAATWSVVAFLVMRSLMWRMSINAMVCFSNSMSHPMIFRSHYDVDINECVQNQSLCHNGACINTDGSFLCVCTIGFVLNPEEHTCVGKLITNFNRAIMSMSCLNTLVLILIMLFMLQI